MPQLAARLRSQCSLWVTHIHHSALINPVLFLWFGFDWAVMPLIWAVSFTPHTGSSASPNSQPVESCIKTSTMLQFGHLSPNKQTKTTNKHLVKFCILKAHSDPYSYVFFITCWLMWWSFHLVFVYFLHQTHITMLICSKVDKVTALITIYVSKISK